MRKLNWLWLQKYGQFRKSVSIYPSSSPEFHPPKIRAQKIFTPPKHLPALLPNNNEPLPQFKLSVHLNSSLYILDISTKPKRIKSSLKCLIALVIHFDLWNVTCPVIATQEKLINNPKPFNAWNVSRVSALWVIPEGRPNLHIIVF